MIVIRHAHMEMEGRYTCLVQTNQMTAHTEFNLIVIVDACQENVWHTTLHMDTCTETLSMHCVGLFPKPSPVCGVYNELTGGYLTSVPFDKVVTLRNGTFEIMLNRKYSIRDWSSYTDITFQCYFVIDGTSWKRGIRHRLFGPYGCSPNPPMPGPGYYNMTEEKSCWGRPREGALAFYTCNPNKKLKGPETLVCRNGTWSPESTTWNGPTKPICNSANGNYKMRRLCSSISYVTLAFLFFIMPQIMAELVEAL